MDLLSNINIMLYISSYLIGSIPFGILLAKLLAGEDIKSQGSKSIGATNVLRVLNSSGHKHSKQIASATLILDLLKSLIPILSAKLLGFSTEVCWMMGVLSVLGHCFSPYLLFEGGKGVATAFGVFLVLIPLYVLPALIVWVAIVKIFKTSSIASIISILIILISHYILSQDYTSAIFIISILVLYKHIPNIVRLIYKQENSFK